MVKVSLDEELLAFAKDFSGKCSELSIGDYSSDSKKYIIEYRERLEAPHTMFRVGRTTGVIQVSKSSVSSIHYNKNSVFFAIIWCVVEREILNIEASDIEAIFLYHKQGLPLDDITLMFEEQFRLVDTEQNRTRFKNMVECIEILKNKKE